MAAHRPAGNLSFFQCLSKRNGNEASGAKNNRARGFLSHCELMGKHK
jgi:hypothetical protein